MSLLCPSRAGSVFLFVLFASPAAADVRLDVGGRVREDPGALVVTVELTNRGTTAAEAVQVEGEMLAARAEAALPGPLDPGATRAVDLTLPRAPRPGRYGLGLHLRYRPRGTAVGEPTSQRAYLLLAVGADPAPPVRIAVPAVRVARHAVIPIALESADGAAHRVRLRVLAPRGVNALEPDGEVDVPAAGTAVASVPVLRAGAPVGARAGLVVLAAEVGGPLERTAVATGEVEVVAAPASWLPRLRTPLLSAALVLLAAAVGAELWTMRSRPA